MLRRLHTRYLGVLLIVLSLCYITFSALFIFTLNRTVKGRMKSTLEQTNAYALSVVETIETSVYPADYIAMYQRQMFRSIKVLTEYTNTDVTICDAHGNIVFTTTERLDGIINIPELQRANKKKGLVQSDFGNTFREKQFVYMEPLEINGVPLYYSVATTSAGEYNQSLKGFTASFWMIALFVFGVSVLLFAVTTHRQLDPIKQMTQAAKKYAKGQFDVRIESSRIEEINELGNVFNNMAESLEHLEDARNTFVQNVSHDLRTPMTTITGFVDGILDGTIPKEEEEYYLGLVSQETKRLSRLVSTLLDISELKSGANKQITEFDVGEIISQILFSFEQKINGKKLALDFDFDMDALNVKGDKDGIYRVIYNLIDNAIKYSFDEGTLRINTSVNQTHAIITVYNTGMGIKEDDIPFIFDRFYKTDKSRGRDKSSLGLGLYITKIIVENSGGNIMVRSKYGEFCEFSFTLPLKQ